MPVTKPMKKGMIRLNLGSKPEICGTFIFYYSFEFMFPNSKFSTIFPHAKAQFSILSPIFPHLETLFPNIYLIFPHQSLQIFPIFSPTLNPGSQTLSPLFLGLKQEFNIFLCHK